MHHRRNEPSLPSKKLAPTIWLPGPGSYGAIRDRPAKAVRFWSVRAELLERVRSFAKRPFWDRELVQRVVYERTLLIDFNFVNHQIKSNR
jgi:hypothetical protein